MRSRWSAHFLRATWKRSKHVPAGTYVGERAGLSRFTTVVKERLTMRPRPWVAHAPLPPSRSRSPSRHRDDATRRRWRARPHRRVHRRDRACTAGRVEGEPANARTRRRSHIDEYDQYVGAAHDAAVGDGRAQRRADGADALADDGNDSAATAADDPADNRATGARHVGLVLIDGKPRDALSRARNDG